MGTEPSGLGSDTLAVCYPVGSAHWQWAILTAMVKTDLAVGAGSVAFTILLGVGDGAFQAPLNDPAGTSGNRFVVADFNQDGIARISPACLRTRF